MEIIRGPGESTSLDCLATGAPLPNVTWSVPPGSNLGRGPVQPNFTLDVQFSDGADAGEYSCTISNGVGNVTRDFTLKLASEYLCVFHNVFVRVKLKALLLW